MKVIERQFQKVNCVGWLSTHRVFALAFIAFVEHELADRNLM